MIRVDPSTFKKGQQISAGNFIISISIFNMDECVIKSKRTGDFVKIKEAKKSLRLRIIIKLFDVFIMSKEEFIFRFVNPRIIGEMANILRTK